MQTFPKYLTIEKMVGETPLQALERLRILHRIPESVPLAYAGRLDPMASGFLLILIGDECKRQERYHAFDKTYEFTSLLGAHSDTGDVLGIITAHSASLYSKHEIVSVTKSLQGSITLPYPHFSSKTVAGKPLHTWTLENKLDEITIPTKQSHIHRLDFTNIQTITAAELYHAVSEKIETIPQVTDPKKALGADFRRDDVRASWKKLYEENTEREYQLASFVCTASSGTYMRSLTEEIGKRLGTSALAYRIHRTRIGTYIPLYKSFGVWVRTITK